MAQTPAGSRAWSGGPVRPGISCVLAGNPGIMTLDGTNTWLLFDPGADQALVVDPGPDDEAHLRSVLDTAQELGVRVAQALLTHGHLDHSAGARRFARLAGCPVRAANPELSHGGAALSGGDVVDAGGLHVQVMATPGHTADSVSFVLASQKVVLTGDTVLGRGTSVVAHPDGRLGPYLASLARLHDLATQGEVQLILPGHGPVLHRPAEVLAGYLTHRQARLGQVREALADGAQSAADVVRRVYADVDESLWPAAELSVQAQLAYLAETTHEN